MWKWRRNRKRFLCRWYTLIFYHNNTACFYANLNILISLIKGFGVCCILILSDGGTTSLNQSYIVQASSNSLGVGSREYTVCPCSSDVCRIRFDFQVHYFNDIMKYRLFWIKLIMIYIASINKFSTLYFFIDV